LRFTVVFSICITLLQAARACSAEPLPAKFLGVADGFGVKQLKAGGVPLLVDDAAGFYLIGSELNIDDGNNIASFVKNTDGAMHSMNGATRVSMPYKFTLRPDADDPSKLYFDVKIGPATMAIATVSIPLEAHRQLFSLYRYEGDDRPGRYDQNPGHYTPPGRGEYNLKFAPGRPKWGEMMGPDYTLRFTLTSSSRPMSLAFVDAPSLSTGVRNVEFGFGEFKVGEQATAAGTIQLFKTDRRLFSKLPIEFPSETSPHHQVGRMESNAWSVRADDKPNQYLQYGPYWTDLPAGKRQAAFRLMIDNNTADNNRVLTLDVYDASSGRILSVHDVTRQMFAVPMEYQDFTLEFTADRGQQLEFRTYWHGGAYIRQESTTIR
jgi:hypothetical protein